MSQQHIPAHRQPPEGCGWESADGQPVAVRVVLPPDDLGDRCPHCGKDYAEAAQPPVAGIPAVSIEHLQRAFEAGREQGRDEGQRELLQWLFAGATTGQQIVDRAAVRAFAATWPEGEPCPLTVADLAALVGVSPRTAARRKADAQNGRWFSR